VSRIALNSAARPWLAAATLCGLALMHAGARAATAPRAPASPSTAATASRAAAAADTAPSTLPQVRVVQSMHTAPIDQIRADARFERLVTASSDKTLRIWRLADLQPLRTVALPAEIGREGTPYSVAMSADGQRIYAAGYTGWDWHRGAHIYAVDATTGRITGTFGAFKGEVVTALDLSPDGRRLAVGLGIGGVAVLDIASRRPLSARGDTQYAGPVMFAHHAADGRLATSSADGCLRVYAADGHLLRRVQFPPRPPDQRQCTGGELGGVRFSPDGRWLALGHRGSAEVGVFDGRSLQLVRTVRVTDAAQKSLCCIAWSPDSGTLFVNGTVESDQPTPLYRIRDPARGVPERLDVGQQQFSNMLPMPDGSLVFATTVPSLTRLGADGHVALRQDGRPLSVTPDNVDFHRTRNRPSAFVVAADGHAIEFEATAGQWLRADPMHADAGQALTAPRATDPSLSGARHSGAVLVQTDTGPFNHRQPTLLNKIAVKLDFEEGVRSWAVHPRVPIAALGTQWRLHLLDARARPMPGWETPPFLSAPAWHTVITEDGRWVVVAVGDGTVHWFDVASGRERLGLFVHANGTDWVAWRPDGYYASSPQGDRYVGWLVNRKEGESPDFFRAVQFERELYRPDLVRLTLGPSATVDRFDRSAQQLAQMLAALTPPRVRIESIVAATEPGTMAIRFTAESTGRPIDEVGVYVDGLPVLRAAERAVSGAQKNRVTRTVLARIASASAQVRVEAESARALGLDESMSVDSAGPVVARAVGTLWVVAIGAERFDRATGLRPLPFATNDAAELAKAFAAQKGKVFADTRITLLTDKATSLALKPTRTNILGQLRLLEQMQPDDTVVVFLASHGITDVAEYYVMTQDATAADVGKLVAAQASKTRLAEGTVPSLLSGTELLAALRRLPGRRVLMLDTCRAGALGRSDPYSLIKRSASAQLALVSASRGDQSSYDAPSQPHGIFTFAMIRALTDPALAPRGPVTLRAAFDATLPQVDAMLRQLQDGVRDPVRRAALQQMPVMSAPRAVEVSVFGLR
jgi:hypothetical protein